MRPTKISLPSPFYPFLSMDANFVCLMENVLSNLFHPTYQTRDEYDTFHLSFLSTKNGIPNKP